MEKNSGAFFSRSKPKRSTPEFILKKRGKFPCAAGMSNNTEAKVTSSTEQNVQSNHEISDNYLTCDQSIVK